MVKVSDEIGKGTAHPELAIVQVKQGNVCVWCKKRIPSRAVVPAYQVVKPTLLVKQLSISLHTATWLVKEGAVCWDCWRNSQSSGLK